MKNQEVIRQVINYIKGVMDQRGLKEEQVANLCNSLGPDHSVSKKTIYNMMKKPSSTTISTLLKVCDALDVDLQSIFHTLERNASSTGSNSGSRLIYNINDAAYRGYLGEYHIFYLNTKPINERYDDEPLVHGTLTFDDRYHTGECAASLTIESGDLKDNGEPFLKAYDGNLVYSSNGTMFCQLVSHQFGDFWNLCFEHRNLNNKNLSCVLGCASTSSAGRNRYPTIHRFCLCNKERYPEINDATLELIKGILRVKNDDIIISEKKIADYLNQPKLNQTFKRNIQNLLPILPKYYALPKNILSLELAQDDFAMLMEDLCEHSDLETSYRIKSEDNQHLLSILKGSEVKKKRRYNSKPSTDPPAAEEESAAAAETGDSDSPESNKNYK
ncbi:MAG: helix-turn-helix domain-containing protein [Lachnospiraceae bacterium]|nr:helix-turn-helix domain-containing protein [Lachnospiraceae bacterium]